MTIDKLEKELERLYAECCYTDALFILEGLLQLCEKHQGPDHPDTAGTLNNLANLYYTTADYAKAEPLCKRSLEIREKALGPDHPDTAGTLNNLAALYDTTGDYAKAEPLYKRSLGIREKALGPDHPDTAGTLNNLANLYYATDDYAKAEPLYKRSLGIREKALGPDHPDTAGTLNNLANLYYATDDYAKAEPLYKRSLEIREKALGPDHPDTAGTLNNLAALYDTTGDYAKAEPLYKRSLEICEKALGLDHPDVAKTLVNWARLCALTSRETLAYDLILRALSIENKIIDNVFTFAAEQQRLSFLGKMASTLHAFLSLILSHFPSDPSAVSTVFDAWLSRKGLVLETQKVFQEAYFTSEDEKVKDAFSSLTLIRHRLSNLAFAPPQGMGPERIKDEEGQLEREKDLLESTLMRLSLSFQAMRAVAGTNAATLASLLPEGSLLIDLARVPLWDFKAMRSSPDHYLAFLLHKTGTVDLVDLGEAKQIEDLIRALKKRIAFADSPRGQCFSYINPHEHGRDFEGFLKEDAYALYRKVFVPLMEKTGGLTDVFLSPDGELNLIPFEILVDETGNYLIDTYTFTYLAAPREMAAFGRGEGNPVSPLLMGDPDYGPAAEEGQKRFESLPATREEVNEIGRILCSSPLTGKDASEENLFSVHSPRLLHLATHGFFLGDVDRPIPSARDFFMDRSFTAAVKIGNPLLRSGIALAGANDPSLGRVTAEKILSLPLKGTEMVVLSACQTGIGEVRQGEGVFGLRRSFAQAGAKSLVMSMWKVPDRETKELMVSFYKNLSSMNRSSALRQAALSLKDTLHHTQRHTHPLFWGAFIFAGER